MHQHQFLLQGTEGGRHHLSPAKEALNTLVKVQALAIKRMAAPGMLEECQSQRASGNLEKLCTSLAREASTASLMISYVFYAAPAQSTHHSYFLEDTLIATVNYICHDQAQHSS